MLSVSEIVAKTEAMFDLFNHHFYNDELTRPAITVSPDGGRGAYGWCSVYEIWQASGEAYREINICAEYIDRPIGEVAATMLHEMAHLYNLTHEIKDVSNNGYYHNKKFKDTAEAHGLHIEHHATYGWTITTLTEETAEWLAQQPGMEDITASRKTTLQIKTKADDDEGGETTTYHQRRAQHQQESQHQVRLPALRSHHSSDAAGQRSMRRLRRTIRTGMIQTRP